MEGWDPARFATLGDPRALSAFAVLVGSAFAGEHVDGTEAAGTAVTLAATALALKRPGPCAEA